MIPADLSPGDVRSLQRDWSGIELHSIESADDPAFDAAFGALWAEFGANSEVEQPTVLSRRLLWDGCQQVNGCALRYRLILLRSGTKFAAVRDHTAIVREGIAGVIVHLSHNLVAPEWRRRVSQAGCAPSRYRLLANASQPSNARPIRPSHLSVK